MVLLLIDYKLYICLLQCVRSTAIYSSIENFSRWKKEKKKRTVIYILMHDHRWRALDGEMAMGEVASKRREWFPPFFCRFSLVFDGRKIMARTVSVNCVAVCRACLNVAANGQNKNMSKMADNDACSPRTCQCCVAQLDTFAESYPFLIFIFRYKYFVLRYTDIVCVYSPGRNYKLLVQVHHTHSPEKKKEFTTRIHRQLIQIMTYSMHHLQRSVIRWSDQYASSAAISRSSDDQWSVIC